MPPGLKQSNLLLRLGRFYKNRRSEILDILRHCPGIFLAIKIFTDIKRSVNACYVKR